MMVWSWWGLEDGVWPCGAGIAQEDPPRPKAEHAVVAGCGAVVEGDALVSVGWFRGGAEEAGMKGCANARGICRRSAAETRQK